MNEDKVRAVLGDCYEIAHGQLRQPWVGSLPLEIALERIKEKIETLTDEDLGEEAAGSRITFAPVQDPKTSPAYPILPGT